MQDDTYTIKSGHLDVGDGHKIYYQEWGNPNAPATFYLHGGPGSCCRQKHKTIFDPKKHHIIFHDQRGSGQSTYTEVLLNNTTDALVGDIDKLREHLGYKNIQIFGYSWGSTLALCYALKYPSTVTKMLIGGIYLGTKAETDFLYENGGIGQFSPEAWEYYEEIIPEVVKSNKLEYYFEQLQNGTDEVKLDHLRRWQQLESSIVSFDTDYAALRQSTDEGASLDALPGILVAANYFVHDCFIPERFIIDNAPTISHIPTIIVQGRFDGVCPPRVAYRLAQALGEKCHLHIVPSSHAREGAMREVLRAYTYILS